MLELAKRYDAVIVGAGPVGLAIAIELSRLGLATLVVDRRPPLADDPRMRPQLLVARAGDLAHLAQLGVELDDPRLVTRLATRVERDVALGQTLRGEVRASEVAPLRTTDLWTLASQPPVALVPIGRLQQALLERARRAGAVVAYGCDVARLRRHATAVSLACTDGQTTTATIAIIATGAARSLIASAKCGLDVTVADRRMIGALFAVSGDHGRWVRAEQPVGDTLVARSTFLQTADENDAGTALLVDTVGEDGAPATDEALFEGFAAAARAHGLGGAGFLVEPQVFATSVASVSRRFAGGDGRAPVVIAGDAAQVGHVFSGATCFVNLALALKLCEQLRPARAAIAEARVTDARLLAVLAHYDEQSQIGAALLARTSQRHVTRLPGSWALAGVAVA